ncbi:hypothetical protein MRX96_058370 [Rhipicephalus microplus]
MCSRINTEVFFSRAQEYAGLNVVATQGNWRMNPRYKVILDAPAIICVIGFVLYLEASMWIRVIHRGIFRASSQRKHHADLPLFAGCAKVACYTYKAAVERTVSISRDPCQNFYRFVYDSWKHHHDLFTAVDAAVGAMYIRALNAIGWSYEGTGGHHSTRSSELGVEKIVAGLAKSAIRLSTSSLPELKQFMAERHLPWPKKSCWGLLEILLDLSGKWNVHVWLHLSFGLAPFRGGIKESILRIGHSATFHRWITTMWMLVSQRTGTAAYLQYTGSTCGPFCTYWALANRFEM